MSRDCPQNEPLTWGWIHEGTGHCWHKHPRSALCLGGWHTSYGDVPVWKAVP